MLGVFPAKVNYTDFGTFCHSFSKSIHERGWDKCRLQLEDLGPTPYRFPRLLGSAQIRMTLVVRFCFFCTCDLFQVLPPPWHSHRASSCTSPYLAPVLHPSHLAPTKTRHLWHCHEGRPSTTLCAMEHQLVEGTLK